MSEPSGRDDDSFLQPGGALRGGLWQQMSAEMSARDAPPLAPGSELAHFRILEKIGAGGMGVVYRAQDLRLGRSVAIKVLPAHALAGTARRDRFVREAQAASALNHPNIVTIYEIGSAGGVDFIAMELVEGQPLREALRPGALATHVAVAYAIEIARGLAAAHEKGIVHRDLKPENLLVDKDGRVKIVDFGVAKLVRVEALATGAAATPATASGEILGTVGYMSPEQARGGQADHRSDIFSLGAILYEMLTGRRAFRRDSGVETLNAILKEDPPALSEGGRNFPAGLEEIVAVCLAKDAGQRFQSARDVALALEAVAATPSVARARLPVWRSKPAVPLGLAVIALGIVALVVGGMRERLGGRTQPAPIRSIAVLPLQNLSGDAEQEYFADGMTDALIGNLARIAALRVISRTSAMRYKGAKASLPQIARELNVDAVVEGSVLRSGPRVRINAQLSDASTDRSLWAESYERDLHDVLVLQRELAQAIAKEIQVQLTQQEHARLAEASSVNPEVYQAYLKGLYHFNKGAKSPDDLRTAVEHYRQALAGDARYAPAWTGLARCYNSLGSLQVGRPREEMSRLAAAAARKALDIDEGAAEAHVALSLPSLYAWDWPAAEQGLRRALELDPGLAYAHSRAAHYFLARGRIEDAVAEARRGQDLDPFSTHASYTVGFVLVNARRYDEAITEFRRTLELDPSDSLARWHLGVAYAEKGMAEEAIAEHEKALSLTRRSAAMVGSLGDVLARSGRRSEALKLLAELTALSKRDYVNPAAFAFLHTGLGDTDRAFAWLDKGAEERVNLMIYIGTWPRLDPLRSDPRFQALLRRVGLPS